MTLSSHTLNAGTPPSVSSSPAPAFGTLAAALPHQYVDRSTGRIMTETLFADPVVRFLYSRVREHAPFMFNHLVSRRFCGLLGYFNYDFPLRNFGLRPRRVLKRLGVPPEEIHGPEEDLTSYRKIFERRIRFWETRPMDPTPGRVVSPADARVLFYQLHPGSTLYIKEKLFSFTDLIGRSPWLDILAGGTCAVFRLTPDKYHYNHTPVSGRVLDIYTLSGQYHSCNPGAVIQIPRPLSKNQRTVTILDTDVPGGTGVGRVAMVEIVALMIGRITQCASTIKYDEPRPVKPGMFLKAGLPKSLFRPGSSTTVLVFERDRLRICPDLLANQNRRDVAGRFSRYFNHPLVETDIRLRDTIGEAL